ncbi:MAG: hypothetical protein EOS41_26575 [Mesorhizobium sp.]|uniref:hypothetical protein n=1 Tax=Mesorhizobium sp. TaxID=1871066 RepID=UPI000FE7A094|nr:hypothetical protein [Mesorhizobium sp.]RWE21469.1 MAG: hypothetical protein EOS41_26575 [Mesorhizobium sp.]
MAVELARSNGKVQEADAVVDLIAAHRRAISELECLGKRLMDAGEAEAELIGPRLDAAMKNETVIRRQAAMAPVTNVGELKMKAAYFKRLMNNGWCDVDMDDLQELLRSFAEVPT